MIRTPQGPDYYSAAICRRGHVETSILELKAGPVAEHCLRCGAVVITRCSECGTSIRGDTTAPVFGLDYIPPDFCGCASPFPWASDEARRFHIENQLAVDNLPEAERRDLERQLDVALDRGEEPKKRAAALMSFRAIAPQAYALAAPILRTFITAEIQAHIK